MRARASSDFPPERAALLELLNMCTMVSLLVTAANLVREKERGTVERLLVSPARPVAILGAILFTFSLLWFERSLPSAS